MNCWLVRAGERSRLAVQFATQDVIAVGWSDIDGLADLRGMTKTQILDRLHAAGRVSSAGSADAEELISFRDRIAVGDVVVTPDAPAREILVGCVTGDYSYVDPTPVGNYHHVRKVDWYARCNRDDLPESMAKSTGHRRTILPLVVDEKAWLALAERMKAGEGSPPLSRRGSHISPRPARSVRRPEPAPTETRMCPGCGYGKPLVQFVAGSDRCVDCR